MLNVNPAVTVCSAADVEPGSIIRYYDDIAICLSRSQGKLQTLALFNKEQKRFVGQVVDEEAEVLHFSKDIYLELDFKRGASRKIAADESTSAIYVVDGKYFLVVLGDRGRDWTYLDLDAATIGPPNFNASWAFDTWRMGFLDQSNRPVWLIEMSPDAEAQTSSKVGS